MSLTGEEENGFSFLRRVLPRSLLGRSLVIIVTPLIILQVVSAWAFYERHWDNVTKRLATSVGGDIAAIIDLRKRLRPDYQNELFRIASDDMDLKLEMEPGQHLTAAPPQNSDRLIDRMLARSLEADVKRPYLMDTVSFPQQVEVKIQLEDGVLHVIVPLSRL